MARQRTLMLGMVYDQIGQLLATVSPETGELYREGIDFQVFNPIDEGTYNLEDGIMVNKTWLKDPVNEETLIRFLKVGLQHIHMEADPIMMDTPHTELDTWSLDHLLIMRSAANNSHIAGSPQGLDLLQGQSCGLCRLCVSSGH